VAFGGIVRNKIYSGFDEAIADIPDGASVMMMSFTGPGGIAQNLIQALKNKGVKNLDIYSYSNFGYIGQVPGFKPYTMPDILVENGQVRKAHTSWGRGAAGQYCALEQAVLSGKVAGEIIPQGVFAQRIRAGGSGVGAFYSPVGIGTPYEQGKEKRVIDGKEYLLEYPARASFGFIRAYKADGLGNLVYRGTARGINPLVAKACDVTIAEVDEIVEIGEFDPERVITPGIYIDRIVKIPDGGFK